MKSFAELFKKYRLRAEFETFTAFGNALAEKGYYYEDSIFSHWQKGSRTPTSRHIVLKIIEIFVERDALKTVNEANELFASTGMGYLTQEETETLHLNTSVPFQVPNETVHFVGREDIISEIQKEIGERKIFLLYGPPGIGKTSMAIKLGHLFQNKFPDGVLWYKVDSSNVMDILLSIACLFGEDISGIKNAEVRSSIVRTLLAKKKVLLIFDNVTSQDTLSLLLPNTPSCCVIISSQEKLHNISAHYHAINLKPFTKEEILRLFELIFDKTFVKKYTRQILIVAEKLGNLPLAVHTGAHIIGTYLKRFRMPVTTYLNQLNSKDLDLKSLIYEDKNLSRATTIAFNTLEEKTKTIFISLGVFDGKDFSLEAAAFINNLSLSEIEPSILELRKISFIEISAKHRYRIHPLIKIFAREKMKESKEAFLYLRAAKYYEKLLVNYQKEKPLKYSELRQETDNIIYIFKKCYEYAYWNEIITLWNPIERFLSDSNEIKKLRHLTQTIHTIPSINNMQKMLSVYMVFLMVYLLLLFFNGLKISFWNHLYPCLFGFIPLFGGFLGISYLKSWRLLSSNIGKAIFFIAVGLFAWGCGIMIWAIYYKHFQNVVVPYPSLADLGFLPACFFWIIGIIYLSKATGAEFSLKQKRSKFFLLAIPLIITLISCYLLFSLIKLPFVSEVPLRIFFNFTYPLMDIIIFTLATIIFGLSVNFFGGKYKYSLLAILVGFVFLYIADFTFSYTISTETFFNGGIADLLFTWAFYLVTWGTLSFYLTPKIKKIDH